ncbi:MAG TPA: chemotaxis protein CheD [Acidobacteriaceae bacterium]|nr:chemotaxis protein CheD [Acidobacteriaceae bacterium]
MSPALSVSQIRRHGLRAVPHPARPGFLRAHHEPQRRVDIGDVVASRHPLCLHTVLGSCVAVCLWDPVAAAGGMNHILVPSSHADCQCGSRCGVHAMELLINAVMKAGGDRRRFVAKAFGAANVLPVFQSPTVGDLNARFVREFLATERIPLLAERMGGNRAVRAVFHAHSGRAFVHTVDGSRLPEIVREETAWFNRPLTERFADEEPVLF